MQRGWTLVTNNESMKKVFLWLAIVTTVLLTGAFILRQKSNIQPRPLTVESEFENSNPNTVAKSDIQEIQNASSPRPLEQNIGVRVTEVILPESRVKEIKIMASPDNGAAEHPDYEMERTVIRSSEEALKRVTDHISMVEHPRVYFYDGDYWYFSGGGTVNVVNDFSNGYRVSKTGSITMWYERD